MLSAAAALLPDEQPHPLIVWAGSALAVGAALLLLTRIARKAKRVDASPPAPSSVVPEHMLARRPFSPPRVPKDLDAIVIGSGIGGLAAASCLAGEGFRVLVLERHDVAGGCTHTFRGGGYEFDTGVHYVGGRIGCEGSTARRVMDHVTGGDIDWVAMDEHFDVAVVRSSEDGGRGVGRDAFPVHRDLERFRRDLKGRFPDEVEAIDKYFELIREVQVRATPFFFAMRWLPPFWTRLLRPFLLRGMSLFLRTMRHVLEEHTANQNLIGVLTYNWGDHGEPPSRGSFAVQAMLAAHYDGGGFYPRGGPSTIARAAIRVIERGGGRVLVKANVESILIDPGGGACGVEVEGGHRVFAPVVVSDVGAPLTYRALIPPEHRHRVQRELRGLQDTDIAAETSTLSLFVGFKGDAESFDLPKSNIWVFPSWDHDANWAAYRADMGAPFPVVFISFPSAKDPTYRDRHPGRQVALLIAPAFYQPFEEFRDLPVGDRGEEYRRIKGLLRARLLEVLLREFPELGDKIDYAELGTPVTNDHYLGNHRGAIYGVSHTPGRFGCDWLRSRTPVRNLYLSGQDAMTCGVEGAAIGGALCAGIVSPRFFWTKLQAYLR